jgi:hypothetical protein
MGRSRIALLAVAVALALTATTTAGAESSVPPSLRIESFDPVSVHGARFAASEYIRISLNNFYNRRVKASAAGAFTVTFPGVSLDRCDGFIVTAVGSKGSRVTLRAPQLACASTNPN